MAITKKATTIYSIDGNQLSSCYDYFGLSTDTKPTEDVANGCIFFEMDTQKIYMFSSEDSNWYEL